MGEVLETMKLNEIIKIFSLKRNWRKMCSKEDGLFFVVLREEQEYIDGIKERQLWLCYMKELLKNSLIKGQSSRDYIIT